MSRFVSLVPLMPIPIIGLTVMVYIPGLESGFFLDDYYNLHRLANVKSNGVAEYVLSGIAGPSGRPLSLITFAWQHESWPDNPKVLKAFNLILHIINGILLFIITYKLGKILSLTRRYAWLLCSLTALIWLTHPIQVTTVLYVVQRMTELAAFFTLAAVLAYLIAREKLAEGKTLRAYIGMSMAVGAGTILATFSKENGILLPLYVLVLEFTLLQYIPRHKFFRLWAWVFLGLPLFLLAGYLTYQLNGIMAGFEYRSFDLVERLLTEQVVLITYLHNLFLPHPGAFSLFHDDFNVSTSLFSPPITAASLAIIVVSVAAAILVRRHLPVVSFAILWFFSGHFLEAGIVNLELYFEHRNYLPSYGPLLLIASISVAAWHHMKRRALVIVLISSYLFLVLIVSCIETSTWGRPHVQAMEWARMHPNSRRAQDNLAGSYLSLGDYEEAQKRYVQMQERFPEDFYPHLKVILIQGCLQGKSISKHRWEYLNEQASVSLWRGNAPIAELDTVVTEILYGRCRKVDPWDLINLVNTLLLNPEFSIQKASLLELLANLYVYAGDYESAVRGIRSAISIRPSAQRYTLALRILAGQNNIIEARDFLKEFEKFIGRNVNDQLAYANVLRYWKQQLYH